jgi:hypothetical protein
VWAGKSRDWTCLDLPARGIVLENDSAVRMDAYGLSSGGIKLNALLSDIEDSHVVVARLGRDGPIIASKQIKAFRALANTDGFYHIVDTLPDGTRVVENRLVCYGLDDPTVLLQLKAIVGGIAFDDGLVERFVTAETVGPTDEYVYRVLLYPGGQGAVCHSISAWQNGALIGSR